MRCHLCAALAACALLPCSAAGERRALDSQLVLQELRPAARKLLNTTANTTVDPRCPLDTDDDAGSAEGWVKHGGFVAIIFGVLVSFWSLAVVVEEYFVPALNIMCVRARIPDDVAGATFMAAGASSPEMFSAIISLFITHSALGAGTIIGSEIFNHLCICAGAVLYSKTGELHLEWRILARECTFYAAACGFLVFSMSEVGDSEGKDCDDWVWVRYYHGLILVGGYVVYALVCSFYKPIVRTLCPMPEADEEEEPVIDEVIRVADPSGGEVTVVDDSEVVPVRPSVDYDSGVQYKNLDGPQVSGDLHRKTSRRRRQSTKRSGDAGAGDVALDPEEAGLTVPIRRRGSSIKSIAQEPADNFAPTRGRSSSAISAATFVSKVLDASGMAGPERYKNQERFEQERVECSIWKKSRFYNAFRVTTKTWQLRWAIIDNDGFRYFRDPEGGDGRAFNIFECTPSQEITVEITDLKRSIFELTIPKNEKQKVIIFQAQDPDAVRKIVGALEHQIAKYDMQEGETVEANMARRREAWQKAQERAKLQSGDSPSKVDEEAHHSLIEWPHSCVGKVFHVILFPFKALIHFSMVDVRHEGKEGYWALTCIVSVAWLAAMSYVMTFCVETLGKLLGISELVMGLTVSAAGTSFPNVFASMLVARQGLGNMAISNAFGSNVFNIFMGLGLPWFLVCVLGNSDANVDDKIYHGMKSGGVAFPVLVLLLLLLLFLIMLCFTGMRIYRWMAHIFNLLYVGFLVWSFGWEAKGPDLGI
eukprot:TRINITY_DN10708_c0_g4_i1.p1 TRINITY_DN10708_c0_g4~~TRINITY_DN10708_c0_g4_i1.p1  ORF type:complete len:762 (+),score=222.99 TRINITY_DN10708_c0_g4_i1:81-2366(+)